MGAGTANPGGKPEHRHYGDHRNAGGGFSEEMITASIHIPLLSPVLRGASISKARLNADEFPE